MSRVERNYENKNGNKKKVAIIIFLGIIFALITTISCYILYNIFSTGLVQDPIGLIKVQEQFNDGKVNILIIGSDIRHKEEASRSDTLIVGSFNFKDGIVNLLFIPRDTRVMIPGYGEDKINHAYAYGGLALTKHTVENLLKIKIDRSIEIDFNSFKSVVDQIGGIDINVCQKMYYPEEGIDLVAGQKILNGTEALAYVRFRGTPTGDLGRLERQQEFLMALAYGIKNKANMFQQASILNDMLRKIKTSINLQEASYMFSKFIKHKELDNFIISTWILKGVPRNIKGIFYLIPEDYSINESIKFLRGTLFAVRDPKNSENKILVTVEEKEQIKTDTIEGQPEIIVLISNSNLNN